MDVVFSNIPCFSVSVGKAVIPYSPEKPSSTELISDSKYYSSDFLRDQILNNVVSLEYFAVSFKSFIILNFFMKSGETSIQRDNR